MSNTRTLIFDIETVGVDFDSLDKPTQDSLTRWIKKESEGDTEYEVALEELKAGLGFSPLTGEIVAIGVLDYQRAEGVVYFQAPGSKLKEFKDGAITYKPCDEKQMLEAFWRGAKDYQHFVTFNGRQFDAPFLMLRSAINGVRPTKDLTRARYLYQQSPDAVHIDLLDQLSFYGAVRKKGTLHLYTRAFGIKSPKEDGMNGDEVGAAFKDKKYEEIARYNAGDLFATKDLYTKWLDYLRF
jgi:DNA polymerase elongation subunit (family B)